MAKATQRDYNIYARQKSSSDKIMYHAWLKAITKVNAAFVAKAKAGKGKAAPLSEKQIAKIIIPTVRPAYGKVAGNGFEAGIDNVQTRYGRPLPSVDVGLGKGLLFTSAQVVMDLSKASQSTLENLGLGSVQQELSQSGMSKVTDVAATQRSKMQRVMEKSIDANESSDELAERLKKYTDGNQARARAIAQTETTKVFNAGTLAGYEKSRVTEGKEWVTNITGNPRHPPESKFNHLGAHGEVVPVDKPFMRTGESLMHPGDPSGSAGNVIYCYCGMMPKIGRPKPRTATPENLSTPKDILETRMGQAFDKIDPKAITSVSQVKNEIKVKVTSGKKELLHSTIRLNNPEKSIFVSTVEVADELQSKGIGTKFISTVNEMGVKKKYATIDLIAENDGIWFWGKKGFTITENRKLILGDLKKIGNDVGVKFVDERDIHKLWKYRDDYPDLFPGQLVMVKPLKYSKK